MTKYIRDLLLQVVADWIRDTFRESLERFPWQDVLQMLHSLLERIPPFS